MRFLVDAQLPPALARFLSDAGHQAEHVAELGLVDASDTVIWNFARSHGAIILTKDEDFAERCLHEQVHPTIVWLRAGNCSRAALMRWFAPLLPSIITLIEAGENLIEVR